MADNHSTKICTKCGITKTLSEFYNKKNSRDGKRSACKNCTNLENSKNRNKNPQKSKAYRREHYLKNIERHKAVGKIYREINRDNLLAKSKEWYEKNLVDIKKKRAIYRDKNREQRRLDSANRYKKMPKKYLEYWHTRRALKIANGGKHTLEQIKNLLKNQKERCPVCQSNIKDNFHIDHIIPLSKNGSNGIENIQLLCKQCNLKKSNRDSLDFMQSNGYLI